MSADLNGEVAIVTGSASGIGRATAIRLANAGAIVVVADIDDGGGEGTVARIANTDGEAMFVHTDVTDVDAVQNLVNETADRYGRLDVLVNNAGGSISDDNLHRVDDETWQRNLSVNLSAPFYCARECLPAMLANGGGRMVHMSSVNALTGIGLTAYSSAKSGILALSRLIATQYGRHGIRSNVVCPGTITTAEREREMHESGGNKVYNEWIDQYPLGRFGDPEEIAEAVLYLASDRSSFVSGSELVVDGGLTAGLDQSLQTLVYSADESP